MYSVYVLPDKGCPFAQHFNSVKEARRFVLSGLSEWVSYSILGNGLSENVYVSPLHNRVAQLVMRDGNAIPNLFPDSIFDAILATDLIVCTLTEPFIISNFKEKENGLVSRGYARRSDERLYVAEKLLQYVNGAS